MRQAQIPMFQDNSDEDMEQEELRVGPSGCDELPESPDTDEGGTSDEEARLESFKAPQGVLFYDVLPDKIEEDFSLAYGSKIAHTFTTGWEIGVLQGIEKGRNTHKGE